MSYSIRPGEMEQVFAATGAQRDALLATLAEVGPQLDAAQAGAAVSAPITAALGYFQAEHDRLVAEVALRIESALYNGQEAVDAYVRGDAVMAQQYGRASAVFAGLRLPPDLGADPGAAPGPLPAVVEGA
jgi:Family of unknown function (DUF6507)